MRPDRRSTRQWSQVSPGTLSASGTVYGPSVYDAARVLEKVVVVTPTAAVVGTDTFTFQPFYAVKGVRYSIGRAVSTTAASKGNLAVDTPFRCHEEEFLDFPVPADATLGVAVTRSAGSLVTPVFQFIHYEGGQHAGLR